MSGMDNSFNGAKGGKSILIADKDEIIRTFYKKLLENGSNGNGKIMSIEQACNGKEAIEKAGNHKFNVILMDIIMNGMKSMDGYEASRKIREIPGYENTPIIVVTSFPLGYEEIAAGKFTDYINKLFLNQLLVDKVNQYLYPK